MIFALTSRVFAFVEAIFIVYIAQAVDIVTIDLSPFVDDNLVDSARALEAQVLSAVVPACHLAQERVVN
jgi:hypothetical protein